MAKTIFFSLAALVRKILFCYSKIKFMCSRHRVISSISLFFNVVCIFFYFDPRSLEVYYRCYHCWSVSIFSRFQSVVNEKNNNNNNNKCLGSKAILQIHLSILINSLKYFSVFLLNCKIRHASSTWKELIRKSLCLPIFRNITEVVQKLRVYMVLGDAVTKLQTFFTGSLTKNHDLISVQL